jgi:hypothetical protein
MRGGEWIVPVVVLIVWVVSTIMKSREEEPVRPRKAGAEPARKPTGEIDKFLQEIDRLRRKSAEEQAQAVRGAPPTPRVRPVTPAQSRARPAPRPAPSVSPAVVAQAIPVVIPAPATPVYVAPNPARAARAMAEARQTPGATAALHLLRSPRTLASAVVLLEVLGPPLSRRRSQ